jgi:hypothetical protein
MFYSFRYIENSFGELFFLRLRGCNSNFHNAALPIQTVIVHICVVLNKMTRKEKHFLSLQRVIQKWGQNLNLCIWAW